jgi:hypothetical protein
MNEFWLPVPGFERRYIVSTKGQVKRLFGSSGPGLLKLTQYRYMRVTLSNDGGKRVIRDVHRLVAQAFLGDHKGLVVNHKDGDRYNNSLENLEWITQRENVLHGINGKKMQRV